MSDTPPAAGSPSNGHPPSIPDHALLHRIGAGSYGEVWLARNVMGVLRAVKIVYRRTFDSDRPYEREFAGLQKFEPISRRHESQLDILHVGRDDARGCFYYVMELADPVTSESVISNQSSETDRQPLITDSLITDYSPRTLRSDLARHGRLPVAECVRLGLALATALEHLHSHGLVHRDIKPSNIVFVEGQPKLADIGLVTDADATMSCVGTEGYMPPEGPGAPQADVFGLGKVLYEISTGRDRKEFPDVPKNFADLPDAEKEGLREFNAIVLKACQPRPADRYATAAALRKELELLRAGQSVRQHHTLQTQLKHLKHWGRWALAAFALAGLLVWHFQRTASATRRQLLLREVQMARQGARTNGWFDACWEKLREVARLKVDDDARTQAAACLSGLDARLVDARTNAGSFSLAYSPDGQWLLCAGLTHERTRAQQSAHLWRVSSDQSRRRGNESLIKKDFHPAEDQRLVTSSPTNHYDPPSAHSTFDIRHSEFHALPVSGDAAAAWKPDGTTNGTPVLFQPGDSNHFVLRDALTGRVLRDFPLEGNPSQGNENHPVLALTPDARYAAASVTLDGERSADGSSASPSDSRGRAVRAPAAGRFAVWDTATGRVLFQTNEPASALAFSPDGRALAVGDSEGRVRVFALPERGLAVRSGDEVEPASNSSTNSQSDPLRIANPRSVALLAEFPRARVRINCFAFTPDPIVPRTGPLTNAWWLAVGDAGGTIRIWRTATGEQLNPCRGSVQDILTLVFHPDGVTLASAGRFEVRIWDAASGGEPLLRMPSQVQGLVAVIPEYVRALAFSPTDSLLAFATEEVERSPPSVSLWELQRHHGVQPLRGLSSQVNRVWIAPGRYVAALAHDWKLGVWEMASGHLLHVFETPQGETADNAGLAFHPDGMHLAFCAGTNAVLWSFTNGLAEKTWPVGWGYGDDLAYDQSAQLWLLRRESLRGRDRPMPWKLQTLDKASPTGVVRHTQKDIREWPPREFAIVPDQDCFLVAGDGQGPTENFWRIICCSLSTGELLWSNQYVLKTRGMALDPTRVNVLHAAGDFAILRKLPGGEPLTTLPLVAAFAQKAEILASTTADGCRVRFGHTMSPPSLLLGADFRCSHFGGPRFSPDGAMLAWGTESGVVFAADWAEVRRRLKRLDLDVSAP